MPSSKSNYDLPAGAPSLSVKEEHIEYGFIGKLQNLKYEYRADIRDRAALEKNFREKFEALNRVKLTEAEFARLLDEIVTPDVYTAARTLRGINAFTRDDGTPLNYTLVNIKDWCKNHFEVVHQLRINTDYSHHRYDVILLINGVPCVQIELKTLGVNPRRAMEQIVDYKNDPGNGYTKTLLCFMQLFIVSNRDRTYYFANNNARHFAFNADERFLPIYEFAGEDNRKVTQLDEFADHFLKKCDLGRTISRYMVLLAGEQKLMVMRPYQVYAVQHIVKCIEEDNGNGFIWHTTGSGKTLTSFKASTLLKENDHIHKCVFVVDRKDLDRQTREEFNKFQEGCVEENTNTAALVRRLLSEDYADKVIVTTIQKLGLALDENSQRNKQRSKNGQATYKEQLEALTDKRIVFIFDECHRSQFGENHKAIKAFFPRAQLFGFTGTPILPHGVLFRGGAEERIRTKLLKDGHIDTVIGLPANLFYSTGIPVCILVLKKCKKPDDVLFINAAEHFDKGKRQNQLKPEHIAKIIQTYQFREEEARYSRRVELAEIEKNDFNLNISRYISTAVGEAEIDLNETHQQLVDIEKAIATAKDKHNAFLRELGLKPLP